MWFCSSATGALLLQIDESRLPSALNSPVSQALGSTNESLSLWIELPRLDVVSRKQRRRLSSQLS